MSTSPTSSPSPPPMYRFDQLPNSSPSDLICCPMHDDHLPSSRPPCVHAIRHLQKCILIDLLLSYALYYLISLIGGTFLGALVPGPPCMVMVKNVLCNSVVKYDMRTKITGVLDALFWCSVGAMMIWGSLYTPLKCVSGGLMLWFLLEAKRWKGPIVGAAREFLEEVDGGGR